MSAFDPLRTSVQPATLALHEAELLIHLHVAVALQPRWKGITVMTQTGELYWSLIEPYWEMYDIGDWQRIAGVHSALPIHIAALLATHWTHEEVCNGGYEQYFFNSAGVIAPEAVAGFRALGLDALASITAEAARLLGAPYPRDRNERIARLNEPGRQLHLEGHGTGPLDNLTERFFEALQSSGGENVFAEAADRYARRFAH